MMAAVPHAVPISASASRDQAASASSSDFGVAMIPSGVSILVALIVARRGRQNQNFM